MFVAGGRQLGDQRLGGVVGIDVVTGRQHDTKRHAVLIDVIAVHVGIWDKRIIVRLKLNVFVIPRRRRLLGLSDGGGRNQAGSLDFTRNDGLNRCNGGTRHDGGDGGKRYDGGDRGGGGWPVPSVR